MGLFPCCGNLEASAIDGRPLGKEHGPVAARRLYLAPGAVIEVWLKPLRRRRIGRCRTVAEAAQLVFRIGSTPGRRLVTNLPGSCQVKGVGPPSQERRHLRNHHVIPAFQPAGIAVPAGGESCQRSVPCLQVAAERGICNRSILQEDVVQAVLHFTVRLQPAESVRRRAVAAHRSLKQTELCIGAVLGVPGENALPAHIRICHFVERAAVLGHLLLCLIAETIEQPCRR